MYSKTLILLKEIMYHTHLAHLIWKDFLRPGMTVIDATAGNGHDTLFLAKCVLTPNSGWVHAFDIQEKALEATQKRLQEHLPETLLKRITLHHTSHETFPENLAPSLIAYNLGYLPGADPQNTTLAESTLTSCQNALNILNSKGLLSITLYPGHPEGHLEKSLLLPWLTTLTHLPIFHHTPLSRPNQPSLITLRKP
jgi:hypothetical protein